MGWFVNLPLRVEIETGEWAALHFRRIHSDSLVLYQLLGQFFTFPEFNVKFLPWQTTVLRYRSISSTERALDVMFLRVGIC